VQIAERMVIDLEAAGEEVGFFAIFDTWVLQNTQIRWPWRISYYRQRLRSLRRMSLSKRMQGYRRAVRNNLLRAVKSEKVQVRTDWVQTYWPENHKATQFRAPVILFKRPKQPFYYINDPELGWGTRSRSGVEVHEVDFHHLEMLREPWVQVLGEKLAQGIQRVANHNGNREHAESVAENEVRTR